MNVFRATLPAIITLTSILVGGYQTVRLIEPSAAKAVPVAQWVAEHPSASYWEMERMGVSADPIDSLQAAKREKARFYAATRYCAEQQDDGMPVSRGCADVLSVANAPM